MLCDLHHDFNKIFGKENRKYFFPKNPPQKKLLYLTELVEATVPERELIKSSLKTISLSLEKLPAEQRNSILRKADRDRKRMEGHPLWNDLLRPGLHPLVEKRIAAHDIVRNHSQECVIRIVATAKRVLGGVCDHAEICRSV